MEGRSGSHAKDAVLLLGGARLGEVGAMGIALVVAGLVLYLLAQGRRGAED